MVNDGPYVYILQIMKAKITTITVNNKNDFDISNNLRRRQNKSHFCRIYWKRNRQ